MLLILHLLKHKKGLEIIMCSTGPTSKSSLGCCLLNWGFSNQCSILTSWQHDFWKVGGNSTTSSNYTKIKKSSPNARQVQDQAPRSLEEVREPATPVLGTLDCTGQNSKLEVKRYPIFRFMQRSYIIHVILFVQYILYSGPSDKNEHEEEVLTWVLCGMLKILREQGF